MKCHCGQDKEGCVDCMKEFIEFIETDVMGFLEDFLADKNGENKNRDYKGKKIMAQTIFGMIYDKINSAGGMGGSWLISEDESGPTP